MRQSRSDEDPGGTTLETVGKALALLAVLLPALGVLTRVIAFWPDHDIGAPLTMAIAISITELSMVGATSLGRTFLVLLPMLLLWPIRVRMNRTLRSDDVSTELRRLRRATLPRLILWVPAWVLDALLIASLLTLVVVMPGFPASLVAGVIIAVTLWSQDRLRKKDQPSIWQLGPVVVLITFLVGVGSGLSGSIPGIVRADYRFSPTGTSRPVSDGTFAQLGSVGSVVYLKPCDKSPLHGVVAVKADSIEVITIPPRQSSRAAGASLWDILLKRGEMKIGHQGCS